MLLGLDEVESPSSDEHSVVAGRASVGLDHVARVTEAVVVLQHGRSLAAALLAVEERPGRRQPQEGHGAEGTILSDVHHGPSN